MNTNDQIIDHEVRIRLLEKIAEGIEKRFDKLESKMDNQFHWVLGTILVMVVTIIGLFGSIVLHLTKLS